jgi:hypothetical protein
MKNIALVFVLILSLVAPSFGNDIVQSLFGRWRIDSIMTESDKKANINDTFSSVFSTGKRISICADGTICEINDSLLIQNSNHTFTFNADLSEIMIKDGHTFDRYRVTSVTAERMEMVSEDGVVLILKRM